MVDIIVIAHNNGFQFLPDLIKSLGNLPYLVVDTGSTDPQSLDYIESVNHTHCNGGYTPGAIKYAIDNFDDDWYFFMHDSMEVKNPNFLDKFNKHDVTAWLKFPMFYDNYEQEQFVRNNYNNIAEYGIFGPIFYATKKVMKKVNIAIPSNVNESRAMERGMACAFLDAGIDVHFIGDYINTPTHWEKHRDFEKKFIHRP